VPFNGDRRAGHVFVATANGHVTVHARAAHDGLDGIGDDSAIAGRETSGNFMALLPIGRPSEMVKVSKMIAIAAKSGSILEFASKLIVPIGRYPTDSNITMLFDEADRV
jgi:hypothetical protein